MRIILANDGDEAGQKATLREIDALLEIDKKPQARLKENKVDDVKLPEIIARIKSEVDIREVLSDDGWPADLINFKNPVVLCPFHHDTRPSLRLYPDDNRWWCYSCNMGGSVIDWVMKSKGIGFISAVKALAIKYLGLDLSEVEGTNPEELQGKVNYLSQKMEEHLSQHKKRKRDML